MEGWGPYRLGQAIPRMQMGKFLPVHDIAEISAPSFEERFAAGKLIRTYRCVDKLETGRKTSVPAILTINTVDGDVQNIQLQTDFTLTEDDRASSETSDASASAGSPTDWDARRDQAAKAFRWLLDENFQHHLGHKAGAADVVQVIDGAGPCFVSSIAPDDGAGTLVLMLYPQHPLLLVQVSTEVWRGIAANVAVDGEQAQTVPGGAGGS